MKIIFGILILILLILLLFYYYYDHSVKIGIETFISLQEKPKIPKIPKIIWSYWEQGFDHSIPLVKKCVHNWKRYNPGWDVRMLDKNTVYDYLDEDSFRISNINNFIQKKSDIIRLNLLEKYGGVWMDSTIFCCCDLSWIHAVQDHRNSTMVAYYIPRSTTNDAYPVIESWFIASIPNHPFIQKWRAEFQHFLDIGFNSYIQEIQHNNIDTQKISPLTYLTIHVSAQKILQTNSGIDDQMTILNCNKSPFYFLYHNEWNREKAMRNMLKDVNPINLTIIKLTKPCRRNLNQLIHNDLKNVPKKSFLGKYLLDDSIQIQDVIDRPFDKRPIPNLIIQTYYKKNVSPIIYQSIHKMLQNNPTYNYRLMTDEDGIDLIKTHFDDKTLSAFQQLYVGAAKGDFIRYIALWVYGGIYLDLDSEISISLDTFIKPSDQFVFFIDKNQNIEQFCFMAKPRLPIIKTIIEDMVSRIHNKVDNIFVATGPTLVTDIFYHRLSNNYIYDTYKNTNLSQRAEIFKTREFDGGRLVYRPIKWRRIFKFRMEGYKTNFLYNDGIERYIPTCNKPTPHLYKK